MNELSTLQIQQNLSKLAKELGADIVGFCAFDSPPTALCPTLTHAISIGVKLSDSVLQTIDSAPSFI